MDEEVIAYIEHLANVTDITRPIMPKFDTHAYSESEYLLAMAELNMEFDAIDDGQIYMQFLKGN